MAWVRQAFCQEPQVSQQAWPGGQRAAALQLSSLSFLPRPKLQLASNKSTSSTPAASVLLPFSGYYYSPKTGNGQGFRAVNLTCSMLGTTLMPHPLYGPIFMLFFVLVPWSGVPSLPCLPQLLFIPQSTVQLSSPGKPTFMPL